MSDAGDMTLRALLEQSNEISRETRDEMRQVRAAAAREADCAGRAEKLRSDQAEGFKRVWVKLDGLAAKVQRLEDRKKRDSGARAERAKWVSWLVKYGIPLGTWAAGAVAAWLVRGCT